MSEVGLDCVVMGVIMMGMIMGMVVSCIVVVVSGLAGDFVDEVSGLLLDGLDGGGLGVVVGGWVGHFWWLGTVDWKVWLTLCLKEIGGGWAALLYFVSW